MDNSGCILWLKWNEEKFELTVEKTQHIDVENVCSMCYIDRHQCLAVGQSLIDGSGCVMGMKLEDASVSWNLEGIVQGMAIYPRTI